MSNFINTINIQARVIEQQEKELEALRKERDRAICILESFNEYREATDRKETSKSNTKWHTYERILYDFAAIFLNKLKYSQSNEGV